MSLQKTFYLLKEAESQAGELYAMIGLSVSISHPGLSGMFNELSRDEQLHSRQIELMQNLFLQSQDAFLENPETERTIAEFMQNLEMTRNYFNQHQAAIQPHDLIGLAIDLEQNLIEKHRTFFLAATDPQIKSLLESLNLADAEHIKKLHDFPLD